MSNGVQQFTFKNGRVVAISVKEDHRILSPEEYVQIITTKVPSTSNSWQSCTIS
jgi:hypothetical protein